MSGQVMLDDERARRGRELLGLSAHRPRELATLGENEQPLELFVVGLDGVEEIAVHNRQRPLTLADLVGDGLGIEAFVDRHDP